MCEKDEFGALKDHSDTRRWMNRTIPKNRLCLCRSVFPRKLTDDAQRKLAECFTTTASFLDGDSSTRGGEGQNLTKRPFRKVCQLLPSNCELQRRVNKRPADR